MPVHARIIGEIVRQGYRVATSGGAGLIPKAVRFGTKYDRSLHKSVFGRSGGRGFRHGRDAGLALSGAIRDGDQLDNGSLQPLDPSGKFDKAYRGRSYRRGTRGRNQYGARCNCRPKSKSYKFR